MGYLCAKKKNEQLVTTSNQLLQSAWQRTVLLYLRTETVSKNRNFSFRNPKQVSRQPISCHCCDTFCNLNFCYWYQITNCIRYQKKIVSDTMYMVQACKIQDYIIYMDLTQGQGPFSRAVGIVFKYSRYSKYEPDSDIMSHANHEFTASKTQSAI